MRFLIWSLGIMLLEAWRMILLELGHGVNWVWAAFLIYWIFVGAGVLITGVVRLVAGKMSLPGSGAPRSIAEARQATSKGE
jgi:hypothetical protein